MIENIDAINTLSEQIEALLDLMMTCEEDVYIKSIRIASEMCMAMHQELMLEVKKIEKKWHEGKCPHEKDGHCDLNECLYVEWWWDRNDEPHGKPYCCKPKDTLLKKEQEEGN